MEFKLALIVKFLVADTYLLVDFKVINHDQNVVYVVTNNSRHDLKQGPVPDSSIAQYFLNNETLEISLAEPVVPKNQFYTPKPFYITPLNKNDEYKGVLKLKLPIVLEQEKNVEGVSESSPSLNKFAKKIFKSTKNIQSVKFSVAYVVGNKYLSHYTKVIEGKAYHQLSFNPNAVTPGEVVTPSIKGMISSPVMTLSAPIKLYFE